MTSLRTLLLAALLAAVPALARADAQGVWLEQKHDFGAFDEEVGTVYCDFRLVNTGDEPLAIINARANCGCTKPEYSREPVAPGDTAVVRVGFDPKGRPGRFVKYINVDLNCQPKRTGLTIQGTVIGASNTLKSRFPVSVGPMKLRGTMIAFGEVNKGHTIGRYMECYNASSDTLRPAVENMPSYINVIVEPAVVAPGDRFVISTIFHGDKVKTWGLVTDSLTVKPSKDATESVKIETVGIVTEDFSRLSPSDRAKAPVIDAEPTAIDLKRISRTDGIIKRTFTISNRGKSPLFIRRIYCPEKAVDVKLKDDKVKPGKSVKVEVTVNPALIGDTELLNARITIISNDPDHSSTIIRAVGEVVR